MKAKTKFFDPLHGWVKKGQYIANDGYGHRLLHEGKVVRDDEYDTKVLRPRPTRRRKHESDDSKRVGDKPDPADSATDTE